MTKNFTREELSCKCGCGYMIYDHVSLTMLQWIRDEYKKPMPVLSGCRCKAHNAKFSSNPQSDHVNGFGIDIIVNNSQDRYKLIKLAIQVGFNRIGVRDSMIHIGMGHNDNPNPREVLWLY